MTEKNQTDKKEQNSKLNWKKLLSNIKDLTLGAFFIGMIMFAGIGAHSVFENKIKYTVTYNDDNLRFIAEADNGNTYYLFNNSLSITEKSYSTAKIMIKLDHESNLYYKKMLEAKLRGKNPYDVWGIERKLEINFDKKLYRVTSRRIIDYQGKKLVQYNRINSRWMKILDKPTPFKSVIAEIEKWCTENH